MSAAKSSPPAEKTTPAKNAIKKTAAPAASGVAGKAAALARGRAARTLGGGPSAAGSPGTQPQPVERATAPAPADPSPASSTQKKADGEGRRGHFRKMSLELTPDEHRQLRTWLLNAFDSDVKATPVLKAMLEEAYHDSAFTERVRKRLQRKAGPAQPGT